MGRIVSVIPPTINPLTHLPSIAVQKRRVAGYARVSTDSEEQKTSYDAQVDFYTNYIKSKSEWTYVDVYTDEGISATSTKNRDGFNRMISDALDGKIDLIITKSVSRFARNTVDSLTTVRLLKEKGIEIYFEKENIWTLDSKGELLITIMSSLAQEESRSLSENVTWGQRKRFADGKVSLPYARFLGFDKGEDGLPKINEEEAAIVRLIYKMFLDGATPHTIAKHLTAEGILSPGGKDVWTSGTVKSILTNEKYKGDALLQKSYTVDFLTKKTKTNEGEVPQFYVENSHPAIILPEAFDMVQAEMKRRKADPNRYSGTGMFSSRLICGQCGGYYGSKVWHSTSKYRRTIYQCNSKFKGKEKCGTPHLDEENIKRLFVSAVNKLLADKDEILANFDMVKETLFDTDALKTEHDELRSEIAVVTDMMQKCVVENSSIAQDQDGYLQRYEGLVDRFEAIKRRFKEVCDLISETKSRRELVEAFIDRLSKHNGFVFEFNENLWHSLVDYATIFSTGTVLFTFKDRTNIIINN